MEIHRILVLLVLCLMSQGLSARMYKWVDENGNMQFSDQPPPTQAAATPSKPAKAVNSEERVKSIQRDIHTRFSPSRTSPPSIILQIRALFHERKFSDLNQRLADYHAAMVSDISKEQELIIAYRAFSLADPSFEPLLDAWVSATPDDYQPYMARALYNQDRGWHARGGKWASETEQTQFDEMNAFIEKASADLTTVFELNKQNLLSYYALINMMRTSADNKGILRVLQAALEVNPYTYHVRRIAMHSLTPRWGGSFEIMQAIAEGAKQYRSHNPRLNQLEGEVYAEAGAMKVLSHKYNEADKLYDKALEFGEEANVLYRRGFNNYKRKRYNDALVDINRAIELYPEDATFYHRRAKILVKLENFVQAIEDIKRAIELDPTKDSYVEYKEWISRKLMSIGYQQYKERDADSSITTFNTAIDANPDDAHIYYRRARSLIEQNKFEPAIADTKKAIALAPDEYDYYKLLDYLLAKQRDWNQIISYWDQYIARNPDNSHAYVERGGAYFHKGDMRSAVNNAKIAADMGNVEGKEAYEKLKGRVR